MTEPQSGKQLPLLHIIAAKLPRRESSTASDTDSDRDSVVSMGFMDADLLTLEPDERMLTYAEMFGRRFPRRRLNPDTNFIERRKREDGHFSILHASSLRHYHLDARLSGKNSIFRPSTLSAFIAFARSEAAVDIATADRLWETVSNSPSVQASLEEYPQVGRGSMKELHISKWCSGICKVIQEYLPFRCAVTECEESFAVKGIIPYFPIGAVAYYGDRRTGYMGRSDETFFRDGDAFAFFEYKIARRENTQQWEETDAVLPQIFCGLGGRATGRIGVVLTELGPVGIYREPEDQPDEIGNPVFRYYSVTNDGRFFDCQGDNGSEGRLILFRIIFEILLCTMIKRQRTALQQYLVHSLQ